MKDKNVEAAWQIVHEHRQEHIGDPYLIDLHHVRVSEALVILDEELRRWYMTESKDGEYCAVVENELTQVLTVRSNSSHANAYCHRRWSQCSERRPFATSSMPISTEGSLGF
jgi:hypothetical protein